MTHRPGDLSILLKRLDEGDSSVASELLPILYDELRSLAAGLLSRQRRGHTLQPTALVHEAYLKMLGSGADGWSGRAHFLAVAAKAMRQILINHALQKQAAKRGGGWKKITLHEAVALSPSARALDLVALNDALLRLEKLDARQCQVVELRFFGGLTVEEAAEVLDVSPRTVELDWRMAKLWLQRELGSDPR